MGSSCTISLIILNLILFEMLLDGTFEKEYPHYKVKRAISSELYEQERLEMVQWPLNRKSEVPGHIVIGGLHMLHHRDGTWLCGPIMPQVSIEISNVEPRCWIIKD